MISGWHCTAKEVTVSVDGVSVGRSGVGSIRNDTVGICGHANTGFSLLYNFNNPEPGAHEISVHADGVLMEHRTFQTVRSGGVPFLRDVRASYYLPDFPYPGDQATIEWSQARQAFVVTEVRASQSDGLGQLTGHYSGMIDVSVSGSYCHAWDLFRGTTPAEYAVTASANALTIVGYISTDACTLKLTKTGGDAVSGFNLTGSSSCQYGPNSSSVIAKQLRKSGSKLLGTISVGF